MKNSSDLFSNKITRRFLVFIFLLICVTNSHAQKFHLGEPIIVPPQTNLPNSQFMPDGHIAYFKVGENYQVYWAGEPSYHSQDADLFHQKNA